MSAARRRATGDLTVGVRPQELIHPFVPFDRVVMSFDFGKTASRTDCRRVETEEGTPLLYRQRRDLGQSRRAPVRVRSRATVLA